jgi:chorismate synthase
MSLRRLRALTAGESHGPALLGILEGLPAGLPLTAELIDRDLARRQKGYGRGGIEQDAVSRQSAFGPGDPRPGPTCGGATTGTTDRAGTPTPGALIPAWCRCRAPGTPTSPAPPK